MKVNIERLTQDAFDAFWEVIAKQFPEAKTGDLSPETSIRLSIVAEIAVREWFCSNARKRLRPCRRKLPVRSPPTPGPWFVDHESPFSALCIKPYPGRIVCDIEGNDPEAEANALLIVAAPDLKAMVEVSRTAFQDRLAGLREERGELSASGCDTDDTDDCICHYEALIRRCDAALKRATDGTVPGSV